MFLPCSFSHSSCFSSSQHPSSSYITAPNDTSHEPGAAEDVCVASSHSDSNLSSRTSHRTADEDSDQGDIEGSNAYSDNKSGSELILDDWMTDAQATDVAEEHMMTDTPAKRRTPCASEVLDNGMSSSKLMIDNPPNFNHGPCPDLEPTRQVRTGTSEVIADSMSTRLAVTESSPTAGLSEPDSRGAAHKRWPHTLDKGHG